MTLHCKNASVLRELSCLPSGRDDRVPVCLAGEGILCHLQATLRLGEDFRRILVGPARLRDLHRIASFVHLQWDIGIQRQGQRVPHFLVLGTFQEFVLFDGEDLSLGVFSGLALQDHHFAGQADGKIGFGRDNQRKRLCWRSSAQFPFSVLVNEDLSCVARAALGCDNPKDVGQKFGTECRGWLQTLHRDLNVCSARLRLNLNLCPTSCLHELSAIQIDFCVALSDLIADGCRRLGEQGRLGYFLFLLVLLICGSAHREYSGQTAQQ